MSMEPGQVAAWMAAQHKEAFDIALPIQILESLQDAMNAGAINTGANSIRDGKPVVQIVVDESLYGYLASMGIDPGASQHFFSLGFLSNDPKRFPMQFLAALDAGCGRSLTNYQQWKSQIVANGWHRGKSFYRELLGILNEEIDLLAVVEPGGVARVKTDKVIPEFHPKRLDAAGRLIKALVVVMLGRDYSPPVAGMFADTLRSVLIEVYGSVAAIPKATALKADIERMIASKGVGNTFALPGRESIEGMLSRINPNPNTIQA